MAEKNNFKTEEHFNYNILYKVGEGSFGKVYKAKKNEKIVAIKKIYTREDKAFYFSALKEVVILKILEHENVVTMFDYFFTEESHLKCINLVMEYCEVDLKIIINSKHILSLPDVKYIMLQILKGLSYVHSKKIMHRDIKPANILVTKMGIIKLADFGLAKISKENGKKQNTNVGSLWYQAPEMLFGYRYYDSKVDLWSVGCIMAELWRRRPIMTGYSNVNQLLKIIELCGSITPNTWPKVQNLSLYHTMKLPEDKKRKVQNILKSYVNDNSALDLIDKLLVIDPDKRVDCETALTHEFFKNKHHPIDLS